jgi:hypothetical protein
MQKNLLIFVLFLSCKLIGQDTVYARQIIDKLTSEQCFGRGYVNNGLQNAETLIINELKNYKCTPLFNTVFTQSFFHSVNTFPSNCDVKVNGQALTAGVDYILNPSSNSIKGKFNLIKKDSLTYTNNNLKQNLIISFKNKLTFSVSNSVNTFCEIQLDKNKFKEVPAKIKVDIENKLISKFESKNIGCYINGSSKTDSVIVFSAHYDHLGGLGKTTYFPGANDNASGVSMLLNLIKYYNTHQPKYKTIFIFFAGEEAGLLGSKYFVENKSIDLKKIKFLINLDLLGTGNDGIMVVNGLVYQKQFNILNEINFKNNMLVKDIRKRAKASNSDHYWFTEAGVPSFFIYTLGGISAYHDVFDIAKTLPLTDYVDVFNLLLLFTAQL